MDDLAHGKRLRKGRFSETGRIYLLTSVTRDRQRIFDDLHFARCVVQELAAADKSGLTKTFCYVVMPDHFHWLVQLEHIDLALLMQRVKSCATNRIRQIAGQAINVWQRGYHDHASVAMKICAV